MTGTLRSAAAELVGTFIFVFAIIGAVNSGGAFVPLAIGFALMIMVYATGHISGGHLNPAVSVGVWLRGGIGVGELIVYLVAQLVAAALAALLSLVIWPAAAEPMHLEIGPAILAMRCWGAGVMRAGPNLGAFFINLTPLFTALLSSAFLGEPPHLYHALAFGLIVGGIAWSSRA